MASTAGTVDALMKAGENAVAQTWAYNDASLRASQLSQLIQQTTQLLLDTNSDPQTALVPGCTTMTLTFNSMPVSKDETGKLIVKLHVWEGFSTAWLAMRSRITDHVSASVAVSTLQELNAMDSNSPPVPVFIGHCSLQTSTSVLYVRGNLFVELAIQSTATPAQDSMNILHGAIKRCDTYLARRVVRKSQIRRPVLTFVQDPPVSVTENTIFTVTLRDEIAMIDTVVAQSNNNDLIEPQAFDRQNYSYTFRVLQKAAGKPSIVTVTLTGAHFDTFHPGSNSFTVTVQ